MTQDRDSVWRQHREDTQQFNLALAESGQKAIQAIMWLNGGAVVVTLSFVAAIISRNSTAAAVPIINGDVLSHAIMMFALGALFGGLAGGGTYLTNFCYVAASMSFELTDTTPFLARTRASANWIRLGVFFHIVTVILAIGGYITFFVGALWLANAVKL